MVVVGDISWLHESNLRVDCKSCCRNWYGEGGNRSWSPKLITERWSLDFFVGGGTVIYRYLIFKNYKLKNEMVTK